jgi:hypothetical protein
MASSAMEDAADMQFDDVPSSLSEVVDGFLG